MEIINPATAATQVSETSPTQVKPFIEKNTTSASSLHSSATKPNAKPTPIATLDLEMQLRKAREAWRRYRSINSRDAVYIYLASVFAAVMRWRHLNCAMAKSKAALRLRANPPPMKPEPFAIVIFCTSDIEFVDAKTRSKWSRVLRYAARVKPAGQCLADFIKSNGGINECARKFRISG